jgi:hypothetical protein
MDEKLVEYYFSFEYDTSMKAASGWRYGFGVTVDYHPLSAGYYKL